MPKYFYIAKSFEGKTKKQAIEAKNERELAKALRQQGYVLVSAQLEKKRGKRRRIGAFLEKVSVKDKMMFARNLQVMIGAGISLPRALEILAFQTKNKKFQNILKKISQEIITGKSFSESLNSYPSVFSELFQNMIKVGEEAGTMEEVLGVLSQQMEKEYELKSKIKGALIYPAVIIIAMLLIGILMLIVVVPKLADTFEELNVELPATTQFVIGLGGFLAHNVFFIIVLLIASILFLRFVFKTKKGKKLLDSLFLKIPVISKIVRQNNIAQTVRTLGSLLTSGIGIVQALEITSGTVSNSYFKEDLLLAGQKVKKGEKLSTSLKNQIFSSLVVQMVAVGEETGETSEMLLKLANFFEKEVANASKNLTTIIEPAIMLVIAAAIGFFAVSMIQPMYSMLGSIK